jgi:two-component system NtrC family sensor kinase
MSPAQWRKRAVMQLKVREVDKSCTANQLMRRTEKLSSLGQLVAGVAHELNNPLAVVMGYTQVMAKDEALDEKTKVNILRILHESERAAKIVRDLLSFARPCEPQMTTVDVNRLVGNVLDIRESDLRGHHIQDQVHLAPDLPLTKGDAIQIEQVINNLISNAIHALEFKPPAERRLKITTEVSGFFVRVTITDSGPGIPAAVRDKIFDPFFTTKPPGKGTGLGLSISNTILQEHHGRIWFESEPGRWTEFYVELPIVPVEEKVAAPVAPAPEISESETLPVPAEQRLLVVDDEPGIRDVLKDVLSCSGYVVDTAFNGSDAVRQLSVTRYDLIISDLCMPEMDGEALFKTIQATDARLAGRIIFVTGDTVSPKSREFLDHSGNRWLSKPFNIRDVEDTVRSVLGGVLQEVN